MGSSSFLSPASRGASFDHTHLRLASRTNGALNDAVCRTPQRIDVGRDDEGGSSGDDGDLGDDEELFQQALDVLKSTKRASTSMIQRRLRIGYNRAARIMDLMEDKGIVGPENGSSPREILVDLDAL